MDTIVRRLLPLLLVLIAACGDAPPASDTPETADAERADPQRADTAAPEAPPAASPEPASPAASPADWAPPKPSASGRPSVLLLGIDGAEWEVMDPLLEAGYLPNLARLVREGARGEIDCAPAMPETACFCAPVWVSAATGVPQTRHQIATIHQAVEERQAPTLWDALHADGGSTTLVSFRNSWPPEASARYVMTEYGLDWAATQRFQVFPAEKKPLLRTLIPDARTRPPTLFEDLDVVPAAEPDASPLDPRGEPSDEPVSKFVARDRIAMEALLRLAPRDRTDLTVVLIHAPDKAQRLGWRAVQPTPDAPVSADAVVAQAKAWKGPVRARGPRNPGTNVASQYLETDAWLGALLALVPYDVIAVVSDHGMTRNPGEKGLPGTHGPESTGAHQGVLILWGQGIRAGAQLDPASIFDLAPTLAYVLGLKIPEGLPGGVVEPAFTEDWRAAHPIEQVLTWPQERRQGRETPGLARNGSTQGGGGPGVGPSRASTPSNQAVRP